MWKPKSRLGFIMGSSCVTTACAEACSFLPWLQYLCNPLMVYLSDVITIVKVTTHCISVVWQLGNHKRVSAFYNVVTIC